MVWDFFSLVGILMFLLSLGSIVWVINCKKCFGD